MKPFLPLVLIAGLVGCTSLRKSDHSAEDISKFTTTVSKAAEVVVYEGLPSQREPELYAREAKRHDVLWIEGFPFYARPLLISPQEKARLVRLARRDEEHRAWLPFPDAPQKSDTIRLSKLCGGFHPDFAVVWSRGTTKSETLICFGCHEWQNFTAVGRLYSDLSAYAYAELTAILSRHASQRPAPQAN